jgi:hypoxanthine-DNA glycosylase
MIETHAFDIFVPEKAKYLILGSFSGKGSPADNGVKDPAYDWYYGTKRNQFWPILEKVYGVELRTLDAKKGLFRKFGIAIADIIYRCRRKNNDAADANLEIIEYNEAIPGIIQQNKIEKIFFTSRFTETKFRSHFRSVTELYPTVKLIVLPSPSPRYARMNLADKKNKYKEAFLGT